MSPADSITPIFVLSTARSGSTLLSHVFNALDSVHSLAEPDVATQFVHLHSADGQRDAELRDLLLGALAGSLAAAGKSDLLG